MELSLLDLAIQNQIIMYQRSTYRYIDQLNDYHDLWWSDNSFCEKYANRMILDAIRLHRYFQSEFLQYEVEQKWLLFKYDIAMNEIN